MRWRTASLLLLCAATVPATSLWEHAVALGGGDVAQALVVLDAAAPLLESVSTGWHLEDDTLALLRRAREAVLTLDLRRLHRELPGDGTTHTLHLYGFPHTDGYHLGEHPTPLESGTLGALELHLALTREEPGQRPEPWVVEPAISVGAGPVRPRPLMAMFTGWLQALEAAHLAGGEPAARALLAEAFPELGAHVARTMTLEQLLDDDPGALALDGRLRLDPDGFEAQGYPQLARWMRHLGTLLTLEVALLDERGHTVLTAQADSSTLTLSGQALVMDGAIVPRSADGPEPAHPLRLVEGDHQLQLWVSMVVQAEGVVLTVEEWRVPTRVQVQSGRAAMVASITQLPKLTVSGSGSTMDWLVGLADGALGIQDKGMALFAALADGPSGLGSRVELALDSQARALTLDAGLRLVEDSLVRFGLRITSHRLLPSESALTELSDWTSAACAALETDRQLGREVLAGR